MQQQADASVPQWVLLYRDRGAELWGRTSRYDTQASDCFIPVEERRLDAELGESIVQWPALPSRCESKSRDASSCAASDPANDG
jgi:hypothetical protein